MSGNSYDRMGLTAARVRDAVRGLAPPVLLDRGAKRVFDIVRLRDAARLSAARDLAFARSRSSSRVPARSSIAPRASAATAAASRPQVPKDARRCRRARADRRRRSRFTRIGRFLAADEARRAAAALERAARRDEPRRPASRGLRVRSAARARVREILSVRPGVTGLCQLAFAREAEILDPRTASATTSTRSCRRRCALDMLYVRSRTFGGDMQDPRLDGAAGHPARRGGGQPKTGDADGATAALNSLARCADNGPYG